MIDGNPSKVSKGARAHEDGNNPHRAGEGRRHRSLGRTRTTAPEERGEEREAAERDSAARDHRVGGFAAPAGTPIERNRRETPAKPIAEARGAAAAAGARGSVGRDGGAGPPLGGAPQRAANELWAEKVSQNSAAQSEASRPRGRDRTAETRWREKIKQGQAAPGHTNDAPGAREGTTVEQWADKVALSSAVQVPQGKSGSSSAQQTNVRRRVTQSDRWRDKVQQSRDAPDLAAAKPQDGHSSESEYAPSQGQVPGESTFSVAAGSHTLPEVGPPACGEGDRGDGYATIFPGRSSPHVSPLEGIGYEPELEPDVFRAELAPNEEDGAVVEALDVAPIDEDERPRFGRRDKMRLGCIAGLASIGLGVGLGVGLTRDLGTTIVSAPVCKYEAPWTQVSRLVYPVLYSKLQYIGKVAVILRAFGSDVSLSDDGDRLAVSSRFGDGISVFKYKNGNWVKMGQDITSDEEIVFRDEDDFYEAISTAVLSGDGKRVAVSFPYHSDNVFSRRGVVRVYEFKDESWELVGNEIKGSRQNAFLADHFTLDLSADGSIMAIGDYRHKGATGSVKVFQDMWGNWTQIGQDINGEASGDYFGDSVSLSGNGTTIAISGSSHDGSIGYVRVFHLSEDVWVPSENIYGGVGFCNFGWPLSMSANASCIAVSSSSVVVEGMNCLDWGASEFSKNDKRMVRVFERSGGSWIQMGSGFVGEQVGDLFGAAISLSGDGSTLVVGGSSSDINGEDSGYVRAYRYECGNWTQVGRDLLGVDVGAWFGESVSLSYNGERLAVGAPTDFAVPQEESGTVTVYSHRFG